MFDGRDDDLLVPVANVRDKSVTLKEGETVARGEIIQDGEFYKLRRKSASVNRLLWSRKEEENQSESRTSRWQRAHLEVRWTEFLRS